MTDDQRRQADVVEEFHVLYSKNQPVVIAFFRRRGFDLEEARDLAQDTFVRAFNGRNKFRGDASFKTWLLRIAANVWRNELRSRGAQKREAVQVPLEDASESSIAEAASLTAGGDGGAGPYDAIWVRQRRELVLGALHELPPQMQRCMMLHVTRDLKYREIAAVLKISIGAVKSQLHEARERLKSHLGRHIDGQGA